MNNFIRNLDLIRNEAENLVDNILEQSINVVNAQIDDKNDSLSDNFAITSDLSCQGIEFIKSNTIESISGKSFEDEHIPDNEHDIILAETINDNEIIIKTSPISSQLNILKDLESGHLSNLEMTETISTTFVSSISTSVEHTNTTTNTLTDVVSAKIDNLHIGQGEI